MLTNPSPSYEADVTPKKNYEYGALHTAAANGNVGVIKAILANRGDLFDTKEIDYLLYIASIWGCWKGVEYLTMFHAADPNVKHIGGWTALTAACDEGFFKTVRALLDHGANPNMTGPQDDFTPLYYNAVFHGDIDVASTLLERGAAIEHAALKEPLLCSVVSSTTLCSESMISLFDVLIQHDPSIEIDRRMPNGGTALMLAAMLGNATMVRWLLGHGSDINLTTPSGIHALLFALSRGQVEATEELLGHKTRPILDTEDEGGNFPLAVAVADRDKPDDGKLVEMLLEAGANVEYQNKHNDTVLFYAVYRGQLEIVELLLKRGVKINSRGSQDFTPLLVSIEQKSPANMDILRLLIENGANPKDALPNGATALHLAMIKADLDKVRFLMELNTSIDIHSRTSSGDTPLLYGTKWESAQNVECIKVLVRAGADANAHDSHGRCLLLKSAWAAEEASAVHDVLLSLPEIKVDMVAPSIGYPLGVACRIGCTPLVRKLLDRNADVKLSMLGYAPTALISACVSDSAKSDETIELIVRELVARGADPGFMAENTVGFFNALCAASFLAGVGTINFLMDSGASIQQPDPVGRLPIHFAAAHGPRNFEVVARAWESLGDLMVVDKTDKNVLHWAAQFGNFETVKAIIEKIPEEKRGAAIDCKDLDGWTPLAWAMRPLKPDADMAQGFSGQRDYAGTVQYLIQQGANTGVTFRQGRDESAEVLTPAELAERCGADDLARLVTHSSKSENDGLDTDVATGTHKPDSKRYISRQIACYACFSVCIDTYSNACSCIVRTHS